MNRIICILISSLCFIQWACAQSESGKSYHVNTTTLSLRSTTSPTAEVVRQLKQDENLILLEEMEGTQWVKVQYKKLKGYVLAQSISKGKTEVTYYTVKIGANCKDGSSSKATGRGACSHHGGVRSWKTRREKKVSVIDN
jgi:uncharacterized protein YgiM (DUF1202 family)